MVVAELAKQLHEGCLSSVETFVFLYVFPSIFSGTFVCLLFLEEAINEKNHKNDVPMEQTSSNE
jgi:hypothetical protein